MKKFTSRLLKSESILEEVTNEIEGKINVKISMRIRRLFDLDMIN